MGLDVRNRRAYVRVLLLFLLGSPLWWKHCAFEMAWGTFNFSAVTLTFLSLCVRVYVCLCVCMCVCGCRVSVCMIQLIFIVGIGGSGAATSRRVEPQGAPIFLVIHLQFA